MWQRRSKRHREVNTELNITAFMNLMVVLVPFLLISAVFSQVSILNLNLPGTSAPAQTPEEPPKALEVIVRANQLEVAERSSGGFTTIVNDEATGDYDFVALNQALQKLKAHPDFAQMTNITILLEEDIPYDVLVQTMDATRLVEKEETLDNGKTEVVFGELFPDISIGSAPPDYSKQQGAKNKP
ncbi:biopolymer transporter ExbD [Pleionea sp. CnH1-48]|uniref:ExbD/TolR family protein n=1 Tax=Pleionea sp. CnH1-48 TaxID=2954494 RepID=UPI0020978AC0|nr:biopolymer transporter ExbD [Pleionea sp. CnH1-48]MCO7223066.1 biopolymer transporter ExbD [Pleionea sp. CnH1-48]